MQVTKKNISDSVVKLTVVADAAQLEAAKQQAVQALAHDVKLQGFRAGKAPLNLVEKQLEQNVLQAEFLERATNALYVKAVDQEGLRPVAQPQVKISKFVSFGVLEVEFEVEVIGQITLPDYKKIKLTKEKVTVTTKDIDDVIGQLKAREAQKKDVTRAAKDGDQTWISFTGVDAKTKEPIKGADGKDYPLLLGSNTFIPGFETNLVGAKPGEVREFTLTFPKDYGVKALQNRKVAFTVTVSKVQEVAEPTVDDAFAAKVGPFKTVAELKGDIKKELQARKEQEAEQQFGDKLLMTITEKTKAVLPKSLVDEQIERMEREERQNLMYRGQTWQEFLDSQKLTEETYRNQLRTQAELRVKAGLVLSEVAEAEKITVTPEEFNQQMGLLQARYPDAKMQEELKKPENRRDIISRMLTDKTVAKLKEYATK